MTSDQDLRFLFLKFQINAAIKKSERMNRVPIVETSATTAQVETVLKSFDVKNDHCDWASWHDSGQYQTDCWYMPSHKDDDRDWRILIKHTC